jgi:hypothetical protein
VTTPDDFEIRGGLRARRLTSYVPPDARTQADGDGVTIESEQTRRGIPSKLKAGERYTDVAIEQLVHGRIVR